jgi:hypothetical protein
VLLPVAFIPRLLVSLHLTLAAMACTDEDHERSGAEGGVSNVEHSNA